MFYLVHVIGYLCQSLFHLLHVSPLFLELSNKIARNQLAMGTGGSENRDKKFCLKNKTKQNPQHTRHTAVRTLPKKLRCIRQARKISKKISFIVRYAASQAVTIWIWKNLLVLAGRMARPQRAGIQPPPPRCARQV